MGTPPKEPLRTVTQEERRVLERVTKTTSARMDCVRRAKSLLAVADGKPFAVAAQQAGFRSGSTVAALVGRFNRDGLTALSIAAGRGRKPTYDKEARSQMVATAQRPPDRREDGTATWSLSTLERRLRRDGLTKVGAATIRRVLHEAGASWQRTRTWCPTGTAQRKRKSGVVTVVDPQTEEKRGASNAPIGQRRRPE
jgi:transposase